MILTCLIKLLIGGLHIIHLISSINFLFHMDDHHKKSSFIDMQRNIEKKKKKSLLVYKFYLQDFIYHEKLLLRNETSL